LRDAFWIFTHQRSARIIASLLGVSLVARAVVGQFSAWDALVIVALLAVHPFTEWVIHVGILHWRPRKLGPWTLDTDLAREHRAHHVAPHDPKHWYTPMRGALIGFAIAATFVALFMPTFGLWLSYLVGLFGIGLVYEWIHYLCHTTYRARGRLYKKLWRHHRLHHFKNEHYWMGVTMHLGDRILGTMPAVKDVATSPTCHNLLGSEDPA